MTIPEDWSNQVADFSFSFHLDSHNTPLVGKTDSATLARLGDDRIAIGLHPTRKTPDLPEAAKVFESVWSLHQGEEAVILKAGEAEPDPSSRWPYQILLLKKDLRSGEFFFSGPARDQLNRSDPLGHPLNQVLMILLLSRGKGMLLHACGVDDSGSGYLFLGNSGHGKTTMARLWSDQNAMVLNDDRIVIREREGQFWMYGTPWHGDFKGFSLEGLPVTRIFFLHPAEINRTIRREGTGAVSMLLTRSFPPLWDKEGMGFTLDFCHRLTDAVACFDLHFRKDRTVIDCVRSAS
jgi:hypothetical protein